MPKWVPGQITNPRGRPKQDFVEMLKDELLQEGIWEDEETGEAARLNNYQQIIKNIVRMAKKDSALGLMASKEIFDRLLGRPHQSTEVITKEEKRFPDSFYAALQPQIRAEIQEQKNE